MCIYPHIYFRLSCDVFVLVGELSPSLIEQQKREQILGSLERFIRKEYNGAETHSYMYNSVTTKNMQ